MGRKPMVADPESENDLAMAGPKTESGARARTAKPEEANRAL
jgi:hypothetical protein